MKYMHFKDENGNALTSATHGVVKLEVSGTEKNRTLWPSDHDPRTEADFMAASKAAADAGDTQKAAELAAAAKKADGAELVYTLEDDDTPIGIIGNTKPLTLGMLFVKENPDADETGQAFS